ncbi:RNA helicase family protein [Prunus dulcis]|uniref:RNA helicase family protein n=1 Tax=Prunus dulcis TaxID=3755 RepID=A0A4Y1QP88_PRUDU|nr:RNA helicase family protein [Prunus dulcis]
MHLNDCIDNQEDKFGFRLGGGDSNTLILLAKRRNKRKGTNQTGGGFGTGQSKETPNVNFSRTSKLSNSPTPRSLIAPTIVHYQGLRKLKMQGRIFQCNGGAGIMEAVNDHSTVIICGETGCGKTTQVPQPALVQASLESEVV